MTDPESPGAPLHLGRASPLPATPQEAVLDYVPNPRPGALYAVRFAAPEFTSLCPVTGQPDFAHLVIDYAPAMTIVESKSLKLFLSSFRNHRGFHEDVTVGTAPAGIAFTPCGAAPEPPPAPPVVVTPAFTG